MIQKIVAIWRAQPTIIINLFKAGLVFAAAFGFSLSAAQVAAVAGIVIAVGAALNWTQVTPNLTVARKVRAARAARPAAKKATSKK